mmetsp:Transcript_61470/g.146622  ORF Transcript_61470/g.146622 Transcript_61470/m.146622 type:complete len:85 (-) Transcript_61470:1734-1988(-)
MLTACVRGSFCITTPSLCDEADAEEEEALAPPHTPEPWTSKQLASGLGVTLLAMVRPAMPAPTTPQSRCFQDIARVALFRSTQR